MSLKIYNRKRNFSKTPEPAGTALAPEGPAGQLLASGKSKGGKGALRFVVQLHRATRLHYDFRLEFGGVFHSWAVPRGPSLNPLDQRLAVFVEDHPLKYGSFEGIIPKGNYGAGTVMVWDQGTYVERGSTSRADSEIAMQKGLERGHVTFVLEGEKLKGEFALVRLKKGADEKPWLLVKKRDAYSTYKINAVLDSLSVKTGRSMDEIAKQAEKKGDVWFSKRVAGRARPAKALRTVKAGAPKGSGTPTRGSSQSSPAQGTGGKAFMPRKIKPMLPTVTRHAPEGREWIFENDSDGLRALAEVEGRRVHLYSRSQLPFEKKFPQVVASLQNLKAPMALDGKITGKGGSAVFEVFDILYFDGKDLRAEKLGSRKALLAKAFADSRHLKKILGMPRPKKGSVIVAKNLESHYKAGTTTDWLQFEITDDTVFEKKAPKRGKPEKRPAEKPLRAEKPNRPTAAAKATRDEPQLTHLEKIFWPEEKITKGDLIEYYRSISKFILPHLKDRPESLNRHPNGISAAGFYQKDVTGYIPRWFKTERIFSESADKSIDYAVCQDERSLLYIVNLGCIEINPWFSRIGHFDNPDFLVIDLDPDENEFSQVVEVAQAVHEILDQAGAQNFCKTSGATGIHIAVPLGAKYDFDEARGFAHSICQIVNKEFRATTSLDRNPNRRKNKIYLDFMQNRRGQTLAAPYCVRPRPRAPVSMPLKWAELTSKILPEDFNLGNALRRLKRVGDLWEPVIRDSVNLNECVRTLQRKFKLQV